MAPSSIDQANSLYAQLPLQLGVPLPPGHNHALSVSMPTWDDVVGYEEGRPETVKALACGYPRFFRHPFVVRLVAHLKANVAPFDQLASDEWNLMVLPTEAVATRLHKFLATQPEVALNDQKHITVHNVRDGLVYVVVFPVSLTQTANRYWQHTGEIVTSRHAELILKTLTDEASDLKLQLQSTAAHTTVRERVAQLHFGPENAQENAHNVFLYPTGMGAIFAALRLLTQFNQDGKAILFGFPYLDSLKQLQRSQWCPGGVHFFPVPGDAELAQVEAILKTEKVLGIFTEFPCNPLLSVPDLERLAALAHAHGTYVVVDDTVASYNLNPMKYGAADLVVTSLSKIFSGSCTVMGGSLVVSPQSQAYTKFLNHLATTNDSFLLDRDAQELADASTDVRARLARMNATTSLLVQRLQQERLVKSLYYPQLSDDADRYHRFLMLPDASVNQFGPLFSIVLHGGERVARAFYDNLKVAKGPSLGTNFTLACPYTLLAHYYELDYVESCGVDRHLVRISIGLEDPELLWKALQDALRVAESVFQRE